jgi:isovaleryl-CoA dehydrogenase
MQIDKENKIPDMKGMWKKFAEMGLLGLAVDQEYGGTGMSTFAQAIVGEEIARYAIM